MRLHFAHAFYGCDTGCCGYEIVDDQERRLQFNFSHEVDEAWKSVRALAKAKCVEVDEAKCHEEEAAINGCWEG